MLEGVPTILSLERSILSFLTIYLFQYTNYLIVSLLTDMIHLLIMIVGMIPLVINVSSLI